MQTTKRLFLNTPLVHGLPHAMVFCALSGALAFSMPACAQSDGRWVSGTGATAASSVTTFPVPDAASMVPAGSAAAARPKAEARGATEGWLQMFGVRLSTATRVEMRQAVRRQGLTVLREDEGIGEDIYDAFNLMPGLQQLKFSYTREGQKLAKVDYVFMTFSDNAHVEDVKIRMEGRFGSPWRVTGREESGPYHAVWRLPDRMEIFLGREWPQRTTYLKVFNVPVLGQAAADSEHEALQSRQAKFQNNHALPVWVSR